MLNEEMGTVMPVTPMNNYGYNGLGGFGFGGLNGDIGLLVLFILLCGNGGFGNWNNNGSQLYPWMNQSNQISDGFANQMLSSNINGIQNGVNNLQTQLCDSTANVTSSINNAAFNTQSAINSSFNNLSTQFLNCCCDNKLAIADLKNTVTSENALNRYEAIANTNNIIQNDNRNNQAVLDKLCQLEIDGVRGELAASQRENAYLQNQLNMATTRAEAIANTSAILANNEAQTRALEQYLNPPAIPAYIVNNPNCNCGNYQYN